MTVTGDGKLLSALGLRARDGRDPTITGLSVDSRTVRDGHLFAALPGTRVRIPLTDATGDDAVVRVIASPRRDMARDGIKMNRALTGSEVEFSGYLGPVCAEAKEVVAPYLELYPRMRRF